MSHFNSESRHATDPQPLARKTLPFAWLQLMTQQAQFNAHPKFCRTRTRSRSETRPASVTIPDGGGDGSRNVSPILLRSPPLSPPARRPAPRAFTMVVHFRRQDPVPGSGTRTNCARPSSLGAGLARSCRRASHLSPQTPTFPSYLLVVLLAPHARSLTYHNGTTTDALLRGRRGKLACALLGLYVLNSKTVQRHQFRVSRNWQTGDVRGSAMRAQT